MKERRTFPRRKINCFIWYNTTGNGKSKVVISQNISAIGTLFLSEVYLPKNTEVKLKLKIPNVEKNIKLKGKVVRSQATTGVHMYKIAIKFSHPSTKLHYLLTQKCNQN